MSRKCTGCKRKIPVVLESELAEMFEPGSTLRGVRLCVAPGNAYTRYHVPQELLEGRGATSRPGRSSPAPRKPGEPLERHVKEGVTRALEAKEWTVLDYEQDYRPDRCRHCGGDLGRGSGTRVPLGTPDLYVMGFGISFWLELKRPGGAVTDHQHRWHDNARGNVLVYVVRSSADAVTLCNRIRGGTPPPPGEYPTQEEPNDE